MGRSSVWVKRGTAGVLALVALVLVIVAFRARPEGTMAVAPGAVPPARPAPTAPKRPVARPAIPAGDARDRIRITVRPAMGRRDAPAAAPAGRPPYRWGLTPETRATVHALGGEIDLDYTDASLTEVLDAVSEKVGVRFRLVGSCGEDRRITFQTRELRADSCLRLLVRQYGLILEVAPDGEILVGPEADVPANEALRAARRLERARGTESGDEKYAVRMAELERKMTEELRARRIDVDADGLGLTDAIALLREGSKVNLVIQGDAQALEDEKALHISFRGGNRTMDEVLREVAAQAGLDLEPESGVVMLVDREVVATHRQQTEAHIAHVAEVLARRVAFDGASVEGHRLVDVVKAQTGLEVLVDEAVWNRAEALPVAPGSRALAETLDDICRRSGLQWRLLDDVLYIF